jgi:hypothetical protein
VEGHSVLFDTLAFDHTKPTTVAPGQASVLCFVNPYHTVSRAITSVCAEHIDINALRGYFIGIPTKER